MPSGLNVSGMASPGAVRRRTGPGQPRAAALRGRARERYSGAADRSRRRWRVYNRLEPAKAGDHLDQHAIDELRAFDAAHVIHPLFHLADHAGAIIYASGDGAVLRDLEGREYIDGLSSLWNVAVGHGRRELAEAASEQLRTLGFSNSYTGYANVPSIKLTERLLGLVYPNMSGIFYASSGSEANEMAIKAARYFWFVSGKPSKTKIISRQEAYHGSTMAATAITGMAPFHKGFGPEPPDILQVPTCYPYRCQWCSSKPGCTLDCADNIEGVIRR